MPGYDHGLIFCLLHEIDIFFVFALSMINYSFDCKRRKARKVIAELQQSRKKKIVKTSFGVEKDF